MESFVTPEFWAALAAIIVIDLVLAGDNAIVIALAARNLPREHQRRAVLWGTVGAVIVRASLTAAALWLLKVPGLMLAGGVLLVWIAYRLLTGADDGDGREARIAPAAGFWAAIRTIVVADAVMGLDNMVAVAGAAQGSVLLVVLGLVISVPIVVWGSTLILGLIERFPGILYAGGAVLAWTGAKMIAGEPLMDALLAQRPLASTALYVAATGGVLGLAWLRNQPRAAVGLTERRPR